jgi:hypothetical protein
MRNNKATVEELRAIRENIISLVNSALTLKSGAATTSKARMNDAMINTGIELTMMEVVSILGIEIVSIAPTEQVETVTEPVVKIDKKKNKSEVI